MLTDVGRNTVFERNHLSLPKLISVPDSNGMVMYYYTADGLLQRQEEIRDDEVVQIRDYIGGIEYLDGVMDIVHHDHGYIGFNEEMAQEQLYLKGLETVDTTYKSVSIKSERSIDSPREVHYMAERLIVLTGGFKVKPRAHFTARMTPLPLKALDMRWYTKDHLGSVRTEFKDDGTGTAVATNTYNYYPFGMSWEEPTDTRNNYTYTGQELQRSFNFGLMNYGARFYDPSIGRFISVDALADHPNQVDKSPYAYAWNNPINLTDPDGNCPNCVIGGLISAAVELGLQVAQNKLEGKGAFDNIDGTSLAVSFGSGFASGGVATLSKVGKIGKLSTAALETGINATESVVNQAIDGDVTLSTTLADVGVGALAGNVNVDAPINTKSLERQADRTARIAKNDPANSGRVANASNAQSRLNRANNFNTAVQNGAQELTEGTMQTGIDAVRGLSGGTGSNSMISPVIQPMAQDNTRVVVPIIPRKHVRP